MGVTVDEDGEGTMSDARCPAGVDPRTYAVAKRMAWNCRPAVDPAGFDEDLWWEFLGDMRRREHVMNARLAIEALIDVGALPDLLAAAE